MKDLTELHQHRDTVSEIRIYGVNGNSENGIFVLGCPATARKLKVIASIGGGWEHVSVSTPTRCPNWDEMEFIKRTFFEDDETVMQLHVPVKEHINVHNNCLHLWRPIGQEIPRPPGNMVRQSY